MKRYARIQRRTPRTFVIAMLAMLTVAATATHAQSSNAPAGAGDRTEATFSLSEVNGVWIDPAPPNIAPIKRGPLTLEVSSPHQRVVIHENTVRLKDLGDGRVSAFFEVDLEGEGEIIADLKAGVTSRLEDEVVLPRQTVRFTGVVSFVAVEDGIEVTLLELPEAIEIRIESRMLDNLIGACRSLGSFLPIDCDAFGRDLETVEIPTPPPGDTVLLPDLYLTPENRATFERFAGS